MGRPLNSLDQMGKKFLAVDVYSRIPVNGYVVNSFLKKIEWAKTGGRNRSEYNLRDSTYGIIVFRNATKKAIDRANKHGIRFIRLVDIKTNYRDLRKDIEDKIDFSITPSQIEEFMTSAPGGEPE